VSSAINPLLIF